MFKQAIPALLILSLLASAGSAKPTRTSTGPGAHSSSASSPRGGQANSSSQVVKGPRGVTASGQGTAQGAKGGQIQGEGTFKGNQTAGQAQGKTSWKTRKGGTGNASGQVQYQDGNVNGDAEWNRTNPQGETHSGSADATYNKSEGGSATVNTDKGSKTVDIPPSSK